MLLRRVAGPEATIRIRHILGQPPSLPANSHKNPASGPRRGDLLGKGAEPCGWLASTWCACAVQRRTCSTRKRLRRLEIPEDGRRNGGTERGGRGRFHPGHPQGWPEGEEKAGGGAVRGEGGRGREPLGHRGGPAGEEARVSAPLRGRVPGTGGTRDGSRVGTWGRPSRW